MILRLRSSHNILSHPHFPIPPSTQDSVKDILEVIESLRERDQAAERIGSRGREFVLSHLNRRARWCYWREVVLRAGEYVVLGQTEFHIIQG